MQQQQQQEQTQESTYDYYRDGEDRSSSQKPFIWNKNNREVRIKREMDPFSTFKPLHESDSSLCIHNYDGSSSSSLRPDTHFNFSLANCDSTIMGAAHGLTLADISLLHPLDSSSNSVSAPIASDSPFPSKPYFPSFLNALYSYPMDTSVDVLGDSTGFLGLLHDGQPLVSPGFTTHTGMTSQARPVDSGLGFVSQNSGGPLFLPWADDGDFNPLSLDAYANPFLLNSGKPLKLLDIASHPAGSNLTNTLFQRRLASHRISEESKPKCSNPTEENFHVPIGFNLDKGKALADEELLVLKNEHRIAGAEVEEMKRSGLDSSNSEEQIDNYFIGESASHPLEFSNANTSSVINGNEKGKKGRLPAKNLMAERRRRKKLNDRLYMLRSVVPKISKMDRASILADAIDYLRELLDKIKLLNDELQSMSVNPSLPTHISPLPPTSARPHPFKEEVGKNSPANAVNQHPMVHVEVREENAFNIHMFCTRRPGLLLSTIRALDSLGLDIQQAVISCFNGFALDIFRAENSNGGMQLHQDQIKATLLDTAAFHGLVYSHCPH